MTLLADEDLPDDDWDLDNGTSPHVPADDAFVPDETVEDDE